MIASKVFVDETADGIEHQRRGADALDDTRPARAGKQLLQSDALPVVSNGDIRLPD